MSENDDHVHVEPVDEAQPQDTGGASALNLITEVEVEAKEYLGAVKDTFKDEKHKFSEFLGILNEFKAQRINRDAVIAKVKELLKGHHDLIVEFSYFFQEGYGGALAFYNGLEFGNKIKELFPARVSNLFSEILDMHMKKNISKEELYREAAVLLEDHPDILEDFGEFICFDNKPSTDAAP